MINEDSSGLLWMGDKISRCLQCVISSPFLLQLVSNWERNKIQNHTVPGPGSVYIIYSIRYILYKVYTHSRLYIQNYTYKPIFQRAVHGAVLYSTTFLSSIAEVELRILRAYFPAFSGTGYLPSFPWISHKVVFTLSLYRTLQAIGLWLSVCLKTEESQYS